MTGTGRIQSYAENLDVNVYGREPPFSCGFVYHNLIANRTDNRVVPCCYMPAVPGHEAIVLNEGNPFHHFWNSDAFVNLRTRLREGPLFQECAMCPGQGHI